MRKPHNYPLGLYDIPKFLGNAGWTAAAVAAAGVATSLIGQSQANENADESLAAQKAANAGNVAAQRATDRANWAKYLQSTGINMGQNPFFGDAGSTPFVPVKTYPWMTEKVTDKLTPSQLKERKATARRIQDYNAETSQQNANVDKLIAGKQPDPTDPTAD